MKKTEKTCLRCGKKIRNEWYCYRRIYENGKLITERYCEDCAACMIDEHNHNGLLIAYEK